MKQINLSWFKKNTTSYTKWDGENFYLVHKYELLKKNERDFIEWFLGVSEIKYQYITSKNGWNNYSINNKSIWLSASVMKPYQDFYGDYAKKNINDRAFEVSASRDSFFSNEDCYKIGFDLPVIDEKIITEDILITISNVNYLMSYKGKKGNKDKESSKTSRLSMSQILQITEQNPLFTYKNNNRQKINTFGIATFNKFLANVKLEIANYLTGKKNLLVSKQMELSTEKLSKYLIDEYGKKTRNPLIQYLFSFELKNEMSGHEYHDMLNIIKKSESLSKIKSILINSHILPVSDEKCTAEDSINRNNGLYILSPYDSLFDKHYLTFDYLTGKAILSKIFANTKIMNEFSELQIDNKFLTNERKLFLKLHNDFFKKIETTR